MIWYDSKRERAFRRARFLYLSVCGFDEIRREKHENSQKGSKKEQNWSQNGADLAKVLQNVIENPIFEKGRFREGWCNSGSHAFGIFWPKMEIPGSILAPLEIRRGTKNLAFQRRSARLAPKMLSKRRSGAKVEKCMKNGSKNDRFFDGKTFQNYALCNEFKLFGILEKVEKSMPKWPPKVIPLRSAVTANPC